jgi:hypothetical protein
MVFSTQHCGVGGVGGAAVGVGDGVVEVGVFGAAVASRKPAEQVAVLDEPTLPP